MAEILRKIIDTDSFYAVWKITESVEELLSLISLREDEEKLYGSFVAEIRQKQWLAYRILIRNLLKPAEFPVDYDPLGKPFLAGSDYHISVTHTEDLAGVIISKKGKVGIDLEMIKPRIAKVKEKFLNSDELAQIKQGRELEQMTLVWSAKEALYKFYGKRQLDFRDNIFVEVPDFAGMRFEGKIVFEGHEEKYLLYSEMIGNCVLVYVVE
jgi:4'-phosphopantetheinyl transferase